MHLAHQMLSSLQPETGATDGTVIARPIGSFLLPSVPSAFASVEDAGLPLVETPALGQQGAPLTGLKHRLMSAFCQPGNAAMNPVLELYRYVVLSELKPGS